MADTTRKSNAAASAEADAFSDLLDNGYLRIYSGSQPATVDTPVAGTLLAELRFATPASPASTNGVITFSALTADASADATGTAAWFRALSSNGTSAIWDGSVSTSGATLNLDVIAIEAGASVSVTALTYTVQKG